MYGVFSQIRCVIGACVEFLSESYPQGLSWTEGGPADLLALIKHHLAGKTVWEKYAYRDFTP